MKVVDAKRLRSKRAHGGHKLGARWAPLRARRRRRGIPEFLSRTERSSCWIDHVAESTDVNIASLRIKSSCLAAVKYCVETWKKTVPVRVVIYLCQSSCRKGLLSLPKKRPRRSHVIIPWS